VVTTLVIAATAIAALIQIRQLKLATQLEGFLALHQEYASPEMYAVREYVIEDERLARRILCHEALRRGERLKLTHGSGGFPHDQGRATSWVARPVAILNLGMKP